MLKTLWAVVKKERIQLLEKERIPEGTRVLVTLLPKDEDVQFWQGTGQASVDAVWDNAEDEVYAELLKK
jgi:hypothetical protein